ncbi:PTS transporter subunit IIC [Clostridium chauvoei]|uniref:PTS sugar transporter subunit IIC n=2 Tax=Clostridium chauvoei TaxID=46867 RepID=A0ABD4RH57_9CLOT|nr:PTS sugar transporter subunit IIC [Clostridium chauvoei]ATD55506.1 regulator [Clostridium chauvoei]ATD56818.1 regulator [Clostridium chauvoei]MBX7280723.1 PTS sugar transporter subunit IIC [Clostridium chauvoei]MBX7283206.1 PTS sugar transporter subunit IIC [Clostridium chauvoei]MBX7285764.1 PTS sugar transporter subunit IIC [Clostridium chauvoei]
MEGTKVKAKEFLNRILNGLSIGIVIALIPNALLGELLKLIIPYIPQAKLILNITIFIMRMMPLIIGVCIAMQFKCNVVQIVSIGISTLISSGVVSISETGVFSLIGTGDVINVALTASIAIFLVLLIGEKLKAYTVLLVPSIVTIIAGGIGIIALPYVKEVTLLVGSVINEFSNLQPILMGILISACFAVLVVSPLSTVAVATAIGLSGVGSGAANLGVVSAAFGLAICGWKVNSFGTSIAHILGSPKMQMANFVNKPKIMLPVLCTAIIQGALAGILGIQGTAMSAGFGISGLIGPINAINLMPGGCTIKNLLLIAFIFIVLPIILGITFNYIFTSSIKLNHKDDYKLEF